MSLRAWEIAVSALAALASVVFLLGGAAIIGAGLVCATAIWAVTRIRVTEKHDRPGYHARTRGMLGLAKAFLILAVYATVVVAWWSLRGEDTDTRPGVIAVFALAGLAFLLLRELKEAGDDALNWLIGGDVERTVGRELDTLRDHGWLVVHGYLKDRGGDIDHVVCGPGGAYAVETKSHGYRRRDIGQAAGNAAWLKEKLGVRWVTGVLCVDEHPAPEKVQTVWVISRADLVDWIQEPRDTPVDPITAERRLSSGVASSSR